jgi:hypothetical protein
MSKKAVIMGILIASQLNPGQCPQRDYTAIQGATDASYIDLMSAFSTATNANGQMLSPQEIMEFSIAADKGLREGGRIGYFDDGYGNQIPYYISGYEQTINKEDFTPDDLNSIKNFWINFQKIWCSMKQYFYGLSIIAQFQALLMAVGTVKTIGQVIDTTRRTISAVTAGVNGVFEWWRNVGKTPEATDAVKSVIQSMGSEEVRKAISDGGGAKAYDEFCRANPGVCLPNLKLDDQFRNFEGTRQFDERYVTNSPTSSQEIDPYPENPFSVPAPPNSFITEPYNPLFNENNTYYKDLSIPNKPLSNKEDTIFQSGKKVSNVEKRSNEQRDSRRNKFFENRNIDPNRKLGGSKRKRTKRRKQSKKKTKRRKSTYKRRRTSSRKR